VVVRNYTLSVGEHIHMSGPGEISPMRVMVVLAVTGVAVYMICRYRSGFPGMCRTPGGSNSKTNSTSTREHFREPILQNYEKMVCDNEPRSNGSIYGEDSHLLSGFPYYDKAY